jgi:hypothetical protein
MSAPPSTSEGQKVSLSQPAEAAESTAAAVAASAAEGIVGEVGSSPPYSVATNDDEVLVPNEPVATPQERVAPEDTTKAASPEIQEAEKGAGASLLQGAVSGEAQTLELTCTSWAATSEPDDDTEDDEEVAARNTLERGLNWPHRAFDELILPATSVSFSHLKLVSLILWSSREVPLIFVLLRADPHVIKSEASACGT